MFAVPPAPSRCTPNCAPDCGFDCCDETLAAGKAPSAPPDHKAERPNVHLCNDTATTSLQRGRGRSCPNCVGCVAIQHPFAPKGGCRAPTPLQWLQQQSLDRLNLPWPCSKVWHAAPSTVTRATVTRQRDALAGLKQGCRCELFISITGRPSARVLVPPS
jgi:hypothetical protein